MTLFDIFKKKKKAESKKPIKKVKDVGPPSVKVQPPVKKTRPIKAARPKKVSDLAARVLKQPQVTEKATDLASKNQYVFKVWPRSNKTEIKRAVEELYGVNVLNVRIVNIPKKQRRLGRIKGWRSGYKKAIVKIQAGQKIEILPR